MDKKTLEAIIDSLKEGRTPQLSVEDFPCFSEEATRGKEHVGPEDLDALAASLGEDDIPTFRRAIAAIDRDEQAWLGFKVVYDPQLAQSNVDNAITPEYGEHGSADGLPLVFFCNEAGDIVASREPSGRDLFQMRDVTRGPSMHNEQFEGLTWLGEPLFDEVRVWLLGASDVASETAKLAVHVGFKVSVVDYDPAYINEKRFPDATRYLLEGEGFEGLSDLHATPGDYVCVLTRGHMYDPDGCVWAEREGAHYVGMMGCKEKNDTVHDLVIAKGGSEEAWSRVKRPIGLKFGAKSPAELAIAIVGELVDVRYKQRYSEAARAKHESDIGRA